MSGTTVFYITVNVRKDFFRCRTIVVFRTGGSNRSAVCAIDCCDKRSVFVRTVGFFRNNTQAITRNIGNHLGEFTVRGANQGLIELEVEHRYKHRVIVHGFRGLVNLHILLNRRIGDHIEEELRPRDYVVTTVSSRFDQTFLKAKHDLTKVGHARFAFNGKRFEVLNITGIHRVSNQEQRFTSEHIQGFHSNDRVLCCVVRDNRVYKFKVNFIRKLHVTAILCSTDFIVLNRAFIRRRRNTFKQRLSVCFQRSPSANLQFVSFSRHRLCICIAEIFVFILLYTNRVQQLFRIERIGVHNFNTRLRNAGFTGCGIIVATNDRICLINISIDICGCV